MYAKLLTELYLSHSKRASVAALDKVTGVRWLPFDQKHNNRGMINVSSSPGQAVVELVTNGLDAVITYYRPLLESPPDDAAIVASALQQIPGPHVDVYVQGEDTSNKKTVTVLDRGCGMSGAKMKTSVLALGCEDKPMDRWLHGSLGQGGATGFGASEGTLIASRLPDSDEITFTFVCERTLSSGLPSTCYAADAQGELFTANIKKLKATDPDDIATLNGVARVLASWKPVSEGGQGHEDILFPRQGTIRRMVGVAIQYHGGSKLTAEGLFTGLRDNLFASEGSIRLFGDRTGSRDKGGFRYPENGAIRGGRTQLLSKGVGSKIGHKDSATLLFHEPYISLNVKFRQEDGSFEYCPIDIEALAFSSYMKADDGVQKPATIVHNWLHAARPSEAARGVIVTFSGQTHERLLSQHVFDSMPNLSGHVILHVRLDKLPPRFLHKAIVTTREKLNPEFSQQLRQLLRDYVRNGPRAADFAKLNEELRPKATVINDQSLKAALARATVLLSNTLNGANIGVLGGGGSVMGAPFRKAVPPERPTHIGTVPRDDTGTSTGGKPNPFDPLLDRPTIIDLRKRTFVRGAEEYVNVRINAKDELDKHLQLLLPAGFKFVSGSTPLRNGTKTYRVRCTKGATDGMFSAAYDYGDETPCLMDRALVEVIAKREKAKKLPLLVGTTPQVQMPKFELVRIQGVTDPNYLSGFASAGDSRADFFNYQLIDDTIYVYLNEHYARYLTIHKTIDNFGPAMVTDWTHRFPAALLLASILQTDDKGGLGKDGATESRHFEHLERIAMAQLTTIMNVYDDPALRQTIAAGHRHQQAMAGD